VAIRAGGATGTPSGEGRGEKTRQNLRPGSSTGDTMRELRFEALEEATLAGWIRVIEINIRAYSSQAGALKHMKSGGVGFAYHDRIEVGERNNMPG